MTFTPSTLAEKKKVIFIMGSTGTGKTKLSINLGKQFNCEIINSDKIQVYKGLDIVTNKVHESKRCSIPHHMLGIIDDPNYDFTVDDFCKHVLKALDIIIENGHLPIIVGGSNRYLKELINDPIISFRSKYDCCFIWLDVSLPILFQYLDKRVDEMVEEGLVDEIREYFVPRANYSKGIRRAIGVHELEYYFEIENEKNVDEVEKQKILEDALRKTKENTRILAENQYLKIRNMVDKFGWKMNKINSTKVFEAILNREDYQQLYQELVIKPSEKIVKSFLEKKTQGYGKISLANGKHNFAINVLKVRTRKGYKKGDKK